MIWLLGAGAAVALLLRWALVRAFGSAKVSGAPSPEEARIRLEADKSIEQAKEQADDERAKVQNASGDALLDLAERRLSGK